MTHPTTYLITCCGNPAPIDVELAPICQAIWAHGIHTQWTCQGDDGADATIAFPDIGEADRFGQLLYDFDRLRAMRERGEPVPDRIPANDWKIWTLFRFPMTQRAVMSVCIPRADLPWLTEWLQSAPRRPLESRPVAEPCGVSDRAGQPSSEAEAQFCRQFDEAMEILDGMEGGKCFCEPIDMGDGEVSEHDGTCPNYWADLHTADDIAKERDVIDTWEADGHAKPEVIHDLRVGVMARHIQLDRAAAN